MADVYSKFILDIVQAVNNNKIINQALLGTFKNVVAASNAANQKVNKNFQNWQNRAQALHRVMGEGWWSKFGSVAIGFTLAYRAMNLFEAGLMKTTNLLRESIAEFGELSTLQAKLAFWQVMSAKNTLSYGEAYKRAAVNVYALYEASQTSISTMAELSTGMDEIAQSIGAVPEKLIPQFASVVDFTSMVAQTTGSTTRQIRQELQSLLNGQMRTTDMLGRTMKKLGILTEEDFASLKKLTSQAEVLEKVFQAIHEHWAEARKAMLESNPILAFQMWEKQARMLFINTAIVASGGMDKNIFASTIADSMEKLKTALSTADQARLVLFMQLLAQAFGKILDLFPLALKYLGYGAALFKAFKNEILQVWDAIKKVTEAVILLKIVEKVIGIFMRLYNILTPVIGALYDLSVVLIMRVIPALVGSTLSMLQFIASIGIFNFSNFIAQSQSLSMSLFKLRAQIIFTSEALWVLTKSYAITAATAGATVALIAFLVLEFASLNQMLKEAKMSWVDYFVELAKWSGHILLVATGLEGLYNLIKKYNILEVIGSFFSMLGAKLKEVWDLVGPYIEKFVNKLGDLYDKLKAIMGITAEWIAKAATTAVEEVKNLAGGPIDLFTKMGENAVTAWEKIKSTFGSAIDLIPTDALDKIKEKFTSALNVGNLDIESIINEMKDAIKDTGLEFTNAGKEASAFDTTMDGLTRTFNIYKNALMGLRSGWSVDKAKNYVTNQEEMDKFIESLDGMTESQKKNAIMWKIMTQSKKDYFDSEVADATKMYEANELIKANTVLISDYQLATENVASGDWSTFAAKHWVNLQERMRAIYKEVLKYPPEIQDAFERSLISMAEAEDRYSKEIEAGLHWSEDLVKGVAEATASAFENGFFKMMKGEFGSFKDWLQGWADAVLQVIAQIMAKLATLKLMGNALETGEWGGLIGDFINPGYGEGFTSTGRVITNPGVISDVNIPGTMFHQGGRVGVGGTSRWIPDSLLNFAPRLHKGLTKGEFPAILQQGEEVLTGDQQRQRYGGETNIHINAMDSKSFSEYLTKNRGALTGPVNSILRSSRSARSAIRGSVS